MPVLRHHSSVTVAENRHGSSITVAQNRHAASAPLAHLACSLLRASSCLRATVRQLGLLLPRRRLRGIAVTLHWWCRSGMPLLQKRHAASAPLAVWLAVFCEHRHASRSLADPTMRQLGLLFHLVYQCLYVDAIGFIFSLIKSSIVVDRGHVINHPH